LGKTLDQDRPLRREVIALDVVVERFVRERHRRLLKNGRFVFVDAQDHIAVADGHELVQRVLIWSRL